MIPDHLGRVPDFHAAIAIAIPAKKMRKTAVPPKIKADKLEMPVDSGMMLTALLSPLRKCVPTTGAVKAKIPAKGRNSSIPTKVESQPMSAQESLLVLVSAQKRD